MTLRELATWINTMIRTRFKDIQFVLAIYKLSPDAEGKVGGIVTNLETTDDNILAFVSRRINNASEDEEEIAVK